MEELPQAKAERERVVILLRIQLQQSSLARLRDALIRPFLSGREKHTFLLIQTQENSSRILL